MKFTIENSGLSRNYYLYDSGDQSGYAYDPGARLFLWRSGMQKKYPEYYDAKFYLYGHQHCTVVCLWLFSLFQW